MSPLQAIYIAVRALRHSPLRSFLTVLGMVIGVASIITVFAIGTGAQVKLAEEIRSIGADVLMIRPGAAQKGAVRLKAGTRMTLTESDAAAIVKQIPQVSAAAGSISGAAQVVHGDKNWNTTINGTTSDNFIVRDWLLESGRDFSSYDEKSARKVAILGKTVVRELFGDEAPIGAQIRIGSVPFQVIGVLNRKGHDQDDVVFIPLSTAKLRFLGSVRGVSPDAVAYILVKAASDEAMGAAKSNIESLLRQRHHIPKNRESDFEVLNPAAAMEAQRGAVHTVAVLLIAIASISLLVGGISIMNIMIVSVTERTREIGIRRAIGARARDIWLQFLFEALVLCTLGGFIGVIGGIGLSFIMARFAGWVTVIDLEAVAVSVSFSVIVGLVFGLYPARRAARLTPINALKIE